MTTDPRTLTTPARWLLQALAAVCVLLGLVGIISRVLPTVPFLIVAAWAASPQFAPPAPLADDAPRTLARRCASGMSSASCRGRPSGWPPA